MTEQRRVTRWPVGTAALLALGVAGCTSSPEPSGVGSPASSGAAVSPSTSGAASTSASPSASAEEAPSVTIPITIAGDSVSPSGRKVNVAVGQEIVLGVTSDTDDAIHAHTEGDGYELEVTAGRTSSGSFTLEQPGSFEVESHHLDKTIVILNAR